jgi:sugar phosphate isomerase/epimerase
MNLGGVDKGEDNLKEGVARCVAAFKEMLPVATDFGIRITIENHGGVSGTIEGILGVIQGTDPQWVGSNLDFGNAPVGHRPEVFEKLVPHAYHTHAKLADFKDDGEATNSDYGKLLGLLKAANYAGAVSIEWEGKGEAVQGVKRTRDLILKHWPELPN